MNRPTDPLFDQRIADWLEDDPLEAPGQVLDTVLAALPSIPQRRASRVPWGFTIRPSTVRWSLAAAAVIVVLAAGGAFYLGHHGQPAVVGGPSQSPATTSPSQPAGLSASPASSVGPARAPSWTATGSMGTPRARGTATLLPDGTVLVAGGIRSTPDQGGAHPIATAELYDPSTGSWAATGSMRTPRQGHTATLLPDGRVLVAGGLGHDALASAEIYDPSTGSWTAAGTMTTRRLHATATLLPNGKVLVAGGDVSDGWREYLASAELYDPGTGTWTATGAMTTPRGRHTATLLSDGKVLVAGGAGDGVDGASAELYDPGTGSWTATGSMGKPRSSHTATLLSDGKVLVAGGAGDGVDGASAELYDPGTGSWTATGSLDTPHGDPIATLLPDGTVFLVGGAEAPVASAELYNPGSASWSATARMATVRVAQTATLLPEGKVLVVSGAFGSLVPSAAELYDPGTGG